MNFFRRPSDPSRSLLHAFNDARSGWGKAVKTGSQGLADAGEQAEDVWTDAKAQAIDAWKEAKEQAEQRFHDVINKAERSWKKSPLRKQERGMSKSMSALLVLGAVLGIAALIATLSGSDETGA